MALQIHFLLPFQNINGTQYIVNIYKEGAPSGGVRTLVGAEHPFTIDEDDDEDIYKVLRGQTGYLRIVTNSKSIIEQLMPESSTSHYVTLTTVGRLRWQGYIQPRAFDFPWRENSETYYEVEFPVASPLSVIDQVSFPLVNLAGSINIAGIIYHAFRQLTSTGQGVFTSVILTDMYYFAGLPTNSLLSIYLNTALMMDVEEINDEGALRQEKYALTCGEILEQVFKTFGMNLRERGRTLYIDAPDRTTGSGQYKSRTFSMQNIYSISMGYSPASSDASTVQYALLQYLGNMRGNDPKEAWLDTLRRRIKIELNVEDFSKLDVEQPIVSRDRLEDEITITKTGGTLILAPMYGTTDTFQPYYKNIKVIPGAGTDGWYNIESPYTEDSTIDATPQNLVSSSILNALTSGWWDCPQSGWGGDEMPWASGLHFDRNMVTGAILCRFSLGKPNATGRNDGIFLQQQDLRTYKIDGEDSYIDGSALGTLVPAQWQRPADNNYGTPVCTIKGAASGQFNDGYFCIDFQSIEMTCDPYLAPDLSDVYFGPANEFKTTLYCEFKVGDKYWNPYTKYWTSAPNHQLEIVLDANGRIETNKDDSMLVDASGGYLIPIEDGGMTGQIEFIIYNYCRRWHPTGSVGSRDAHNRIIYNLKIEVKGLKNPSGLSSDSNTYIKDVVQAGKQTEEVSLTYGTRNNNESISSPSFLRMKRTEGSTTYYDDVETATVDGSTQRIENVLLDRLAAYHGKVRKTFEVRREYQGGTSAEADPMNRYIYNGSKLFIRVLKHVDFRDDTMDTLFMEVKDIG